jgi:hypothetical protein
MTRRWIALPVLIALLFVSGVAASKRPTAPKSFVHHLRPTADIESRSLPPIDLAARLAEDERLRDEPAPFRVAYAIPLRASPRDAGTWEEIPGVGSVWRLRVDSPGAVFLSFKFADFELPEGAELHFVSVGRDYHDGAYTERHNRPPRRFGSPMVPGDSAVIELFLPEGSEPASLELESVSHGFRNVMGMGSFAPRGGAPTAASESLDAGASMLAAGPFSCQRDINCEEGAPYQDVKRAVAEAYDGQYICSGQLINNTRQDNRYLYITAEHCEWWIDPPTMAYYWNYENSTCGSNDAPLRFSTGSTDLYHSAAADLDLLELDGVESISRAATTSTSSAGTAAGMRQRPPPRSDSRPTNPSRFRSATIRSSIARPAAARTAGDRITGESTRMTWVSRRAALREACCSIKTICSSAS